MPAAGGAGTMESLRGQAQSLRAQQAELASSEHGALLALYAAEASHSRARTEAIRLERKLAALERQEASARKRASVLRRAVEVSQARVARALRALYIGGDPDPIAVVLGAQSLDEVMAGIESLQRSAAQNARLAREARSRAVELAVVQERLRERSTAATHARDEAVAAAASLAHAAAGRRATLADVRERADVTDRRLEALLRQAQAAQERSTEITASQESVSAGEPAPAGTTEEPESVHADAVETELVSVVPPPGESRTLVVDAVAYHLPGRTASGLPVGPGVVAVDPRLIPLGTRLFIPGYGPGIAADTGSAIKGRIIDLWMPTYAATQSWGHRTVTITIYG
jgi:3D (Asp-Asp-Asp) domain-containing protein